MDSEAISIRGDIQRMNREIDKLSNRVELLEGGETKDRQKGKWPWPNLGPKIQPQIIRFPIMCNKGNSRQ